MAADTWDTSRCNETSGFLFSHECYMVPHETCQRCQKPICLEHAHENGDSKVCTSCAKKRRSRQRGSAQRQTHFDDTDYDPYFYHGFYYGYGHHRSPDSVSHDPFDFTEADASGLAGDMDGGFENDMSAS